MLCAGAMVWAAVLGAYGASEVWAHMVNPRTAAPYRPVRLITFGAATFLYVACLAWVAG